MEINGVKIMVVSVGLLCVSTFATSVAWLDEKVKLSVGLFGYKVKIFIMYASCVLIVYLARS